MLPVRAVWPTSWMKRRAEMSRVFVTVSILPKLEFSRKIFENPHVRCHGNAPSGSRVVPCGRTDVKLLTVTFRNLTSAHKNMRCCLDDLWDVSVSYFRSWETDWTFLSLHRYAVCSRRNSFIHLSVPEYFWKLLWRASAWECWLMPVVLHRLLILSVTHTHFSKQSQSFSVETFRECAAEWEPCVPFS